MFEKFVFVLLVGSIGFCVGGFCETLRNSKNGELLLEESGIPDEALAESDSPEHYGPGRSLQYFLNNVTDLQLSQGVNTAWLEDKGVVRFVQESSRHDKFAEVGVAVDINGEDARIYFKLPIAKALSLDKNDVIEVCGKPVKLCANGIECESVTFVKDDE